MSEFGTSINDKKRFILRNPDGTFAHCLKTGEKDSALEQKECPQNQHIHQDVDNLTISDDELQFIIENYDQFDYNIVIKHFLDSFRIYRLLFFLFFISEMGLTCFLMFLTWEKREGTIITLENIYKDLNSKEACILFFSIFIASFFINGVFYPLGLCSIVKKNVKVFKFFANFCMYTAIATVFMIYINILFIFIFVLRIIMYGCAKYIINLLSSIIVLPRYGTTNVNNIHLRV